MKLNLLFALGVFACLCFSSCKKEESETEVAQEIDEDYRQQYVGEYQFSYFSSVTILLSPVTTTIDTATYVGRIELFEDNQVLIDWRPGLDPRSFVVTEDGDLICGNLNQLGFFETDLLHLEYDDNSCGFGGPQGANYELLLTGDKIGD
ncbi:MAG: hypothetical protein ACPGWM_09770 [Flavobacteriales bacterium]